MSKHDPRVTLQYLRNAIREAEDIGRGLTVDQLHESRVLTLAFERCFEIIGEAIKRLPPDLCAKYPQVEWKKAAGARDRVIHDYDQVEHRVLLDAVRMHFPILTRTIVQMLADLGGEFPTEEQPPSP